MARKKKIEYHSYTEGSIRYMSCMLCGHYEVVGESATGVKCSNCVMKIMMNQYPQEEPKSYKPTGRPAGWHWMNEFVDVDGNVFHKGKEQPKLKGTLKPTVVKPRKITKRRTRHQILLGIDAERKSELKKAVQKQKDFLNHNIDKG
jgi:ribosomal protein S27E